MHSLYEVYLKTIYRIFRYLKRTPGKGLLFKKDNHMRIEAFTNAEWVGGLVSDRRSTSGYCMSQPGLDGLTGLSTSFGPNHWPKYLS